MIRQIALSLLFLVSVNTFLKPKSPQKRFDIFKRTHIIKERMQSSECFEVMQSRKINYKGRNCKKTNTFIQAPIQDVKDICKKKGRLVKKEEMIRSRKPFNITVCNVVKPDQFPNCTYGGYTKKAKIIIKCIEGFPVHFDGNENYESVLWL